MRSRTWPVAWLTVGALLMMPRLASAQPAALPQGPSFRVETEIFEGESTTPASRHLILFDAGVIYDLDLANDRRAATVFDPVRGRVILLDKQGKIQTELSTEQLIEATAKLSLAARQGGKADAFGLNAEIVPAPEDRFETHFGEYRYATTTQSVRNPALAQAYQEFAVWAARLNVLRRRGAPPFGRMTLGEAIAASGRMPLDLTLQVASGRKSQTYRAHHLVVERLSDLDRRSIDELGDALASFKQVPLEQFPADL